MTPKNRQAKAILFVDDEVMSTKWFEKSFNKDYTVYCANSADSALTMMQLYGDDIAIVVTDFRMPGRDGLELLRTLDKTHPWIVKILVSAYVDKDLALEAINQQVVFRVLEKPWDDKEMRRSLKAALLTFQQNVAARDRIESSINGMRDSLTFIAAEFNAPLSVIASCIHMIENALNGVDISQKAPHQLDGVLPALHASARNLIICQNLMKEFTQSTDTAFATTETSPIHAARLVHLLCTEMTLSKALPESWVKLNIKNDFFIETKQNLVYLCLTCVVQNAIHALQNQTKTPLIEIRILKSKATTIIAGHSISVIDNGPGIKPELLARILANRPSASHAQATNGSGLGLMLCKKIMLSLNGDISVHSTIAGTTVTLHFPFNKKDET